MARTAARPSARATRRCPRRSTSRAMPATSPASTRTSPAEATRTPGPTWHPSRIVVVAGPWNFPYAIPASGLVHAIAAGCSVVMKPAPETRAVAAHLVDQLLRAGVPDGVVQLACTPDDEVGRRLVTHPDVDLVMLTGSYDTASMFLGLEARPPRPGGDERQERARHHGGRRPRPGHQGPRALRLRPLGAEVLRRQPGHRRGVRLRRPVLPPPARRRRAQPARRIAHWTRRPRPARSSHPPAATCCGR